MTTPVEEDEDTSLQPNSVNASATNQQTSVGDTVLATAGYDHTIKLWHIHTSLCIKTFQHPDSQVNDLSITPDRKLVAAAGFQHVRIYDVQSTNQNPTLNFEGLSKNVTTIGFNRNAQWMYSGGEDNRARIWDLRASQPNCEREFVTYSPITCATLHPNNSELIISDQNGTIYVWDLRNDKNEQLIPDQSSSVPVQHVAIDPLGTHLAAVNNKDDLYVWKLEQEAGESEPLKLSPFHKMKVHKRYALKCRFSPDSNLLATTSADQTCKIWRMSDFSLAADLPSGQRWIWDAAFTGDSQFIITASSDNLARLWSVETGQSKREYNGHQKPVCCVAYRDPSITY